MRRPTRGVTSASSEIHFLGRRQYKRRSLKWCDATTMIPSPVGRDFAQEGELECEMSSQRTGDNRQGECERSVGAGTTRQANAEEMLAELKRLLESAGRPPFASRPSSPSASIVSATPATAGQPLPSTDFHKAYDSADDLWSVGSLERRSADLRDAYGQHQDLTGEATQLRSRRWRLAAAGLGLGLAALAGVGLALMPAARWWRSTISVAPIQAQSSVQAPDATSFVASSDSGGSLTKDGALPDHVQVGGTEAGSNAAESTPKTSVAIDTQRPAEGFNTEAFAATAGTPASGSAGAGSASTALSAAGLEPVPSGLVRPDGTPIARTSTASADVTSPAEAPTQTEASPTPGIKVESARPPAKKTDLLATPKASKKPERKIVAKNEKATAGAIAEAPKQPAPPLQSEKPVTPATPTATAPVAAAPTAPTTPATFAAQTVGQLTHAFVYVTHLPVALIQHATNPNAEAQ